MDLRPGILAVMGNVFDDMSDEEFMHKEIELGVLAEELGFGTWWCVEHHFDRPYSMCPDNFVYLSYLAAKTTEIKLGIGACILPWNHPLRVAEKINLLDVLSHGRVEVGFGRGLSQIEYDGFGIDMNTARERWNEAYDMIRRGQENGYVENEGEFYPQSKVDLTPYSGIPLKGRTTEIAMSEESQVSAAKLGLKMATFAVTPMEKMVPALDKYRATFEDAHGVPAPPPGVVDMITIHEDEEEALRLHREAVGSYFFSLVRHYGLDDGHFKDIKGYESYDDLAKMFQSAGLDAGAENYVQANTYGTPEQVIERLRHNLEVGGDFDLISVFSLGGRSHEQAGEMMRTFSEEVMPEWIKMREAKAVAAPA